MNDALHKTIKRVMGTAALACTVPLAGGALAQDNSDKPRMHEDWHKMQEEVISAEAILGGDVSNGLNPVGSVDKLILSEDGSRVEYILYDVPYPYSFYGAQDGFTTFEGVEFMHWGNDVTVRFDDDEEPRAPEELELTETEAESRLVENVIHETVMFENEELREVEDLLIDRDNGEIVYFVVDMEAESLFDSDRRAIPADMISIQDDGSLVASTSIQGVDDISQEYDEAYL